MVWEAKRDTNATALYFDNFNLSHRHIFITYYDNFAFATGNNESVALIIL
jgi:hypothetical protein